MIIDTKGLVLQYIKFRETSIVVKIYTEKLGIQSYLVNGVRSSKSSSKMSLYQPLTLLDLVVYHKPGDGLQRISQVKIDYPYKQIPYHSIRFCIAGLLNEIMLKCLREAEENEPMFRFLKKSCLSLDSLEGDILKDFHVHFLFDFSVFVGIGISGSDQILMHTVLTYESEKYRYIKQWIDLKMNGISTPILHATDRSLLLDALIAYYTYHLEHFGELKSLEVLRSL